MIVRAVASIYLLFAFMAQAYAEQSADFGDLRVHYSAFDSQFLTVDIARQYGVLRSRSRGVVNIAIQQQRENGRVAVPASVRGHVSNLAGQQRTLEFREVREGKAIYYIGDFRFSDRENLRFEITISTFSSNETHKLKFQKTLYWNE